MQQPLKRLSTLRRRAHHQHPRNRRYQNLIWPETQCASPATPATPKLLLCNGTLAAEIEHCELFKEIYSSGHHRIYFRIPMCRGVGAISM